MKRNTFSKFKSFLRKRIPKSYIRKWDRLRAHHVPLDPAYRGLIEECELTIRWQGTNECLRDHHYWASMLRKCAYRIAQCRYFPPARPHAGHIYVEIAKDALQRLRSTELQHCEFVQQAESMLQTTSSQQKCFEEQARCVTLNTSTIKYDALLNFCMTQAHLSLLGQDEISENDLMQIAQCVSAAATSCNRQPTLIYGTLSPALATKCLAACSGECQVAQSAPAFLCFCADTGAYSMPDELRMPHLDVAMGIQNGILAAQSLGLSLSVLDCGEHSEASHRALRELLEIPHHITIVAYCILGRPIDPILRFANKPVASFVKMV